MSDLNHPDHPVDRRVKVTHLVFGLFFLGLAGMWALVAGDVITADRLGIFAPAVLIVAGVIGLAASLANNNNSGRSRREQPYDETPQHDHQTDDHTEEIR
jgi:hypothetical protein